MERVVIGLNVESSSTSLPMVHVLHAQSIVDLLEMASNVDRRNVVRGRSC